MLLLLPIKFVLGGHLALSLRHDWPQDFRAVGSPSWKEVLWPSALPGEFYGSILFGRFRQLPSFSSRLSRFYIACAIVAWAHAIVVSLLVLLLLWHFFLGPALSDIASQA
ncbi:hypothetical protein N788_13685 [Arenimonas donghaensis DSM 18148 = HO3-R19]|uniref:Uncharacterized protein n=1 Tax=Arenimonas donghaensis DSM 18148 = HO3-R19 TaxID=1121014 RepID=A0A087MGX5_9GAMM|nr:hypothetical protein N788_13685 [Arenimonas donghaensis DSM 18148 = HO3-R19]